MDTWRASVPQYAQSSSGLTVNPDRIHASSSKVGRPHMDKAKYLIGAPEFVGEVATSEAAYDLFDKMQDYERHGVGEYLVLDDP